MEARRRTGVTVPSPGTSWVAHAVRLGERARSGPLRHGESTWNAENLFTGWVDVDLTAKGEAEARQAGRSCAAEQRTGASTCGCCTPRS